MKNWLRRVRGAVGMALTWAVVGFVVGMGIELIHNIWPNPIGSAVDYLAGGAGLSRLSWGCGLLSRARDCSAPPQIR